MVKIIKIISNALKIKQLINILCKISNWIDNALISIEHVEKQLEGSEIFENIKTHLDAIYDGLNKINMALKKVTDKICPKTEIVKLANTLPEDALKSMRYFNYNGFE